LMRQAPPHCPDADDPDTDRLRTRPQQFEHVHGLDHSCRVVLTAEATSRGMRQSR
jgi:hypothetical protein